MDEMTVARAEELRRYWRDYPPTHILVRAQLGIGSKGEDDSDEPPTPGAL